MPQISLVQLASIRESIQDDLMAYLDGMPERTVRDVCDIVVKNFDSIQIPTIPEAGEEVIMDN